MLFLEYDFHINEDTLYLKTDLWAGCLELFPKFWSNKALSKLCVRGTFISEFHITRVLQSSFHKEDRKHKTSPEVSETIKPQMTVCKSVLPVLPGMLSHPYSTEHSMKWNKKDIKLYVGYLALFRTHEEHELAATFSSFILQALPGAVSLPVLQTQFPWFRRQHRAAGKTVKTCTRGMWAWGLWQGNLHTEQRCCEVKCRRVWIWVCCHPKPPCQGSVTKVVTCCQ